MTPLELIEKYRESSEVCTDPAECQQIKREFLKQLNLPTGLLPLDDLVEIGRHKESGFVWLKQKNPKDYLFEKAGNVVWYDSVITAFTEDRRMKKITGVKGRVIIWITVSDIYIPDPKSDKIVYATPAGLSRSYPISFYVEEDDENDQKK